MKKIDQDNHVLVYVFKEQLVFKSMLQHLSLNWKEYKKRFGKISQREITLTVLEFWKEEIALL